MSEEHDKLHSLLPEQRDSEAALHLAQRELEVIFESAVVGITLVRDRIIQRCNRRLEEIFAYEPGEMTGQSTRIWYQNEEQYSGIGAEAYATLLQGNYHRREQEFVRKDGSTFWGQIAGRALDPAHPQDGSVWLLEDISEHRRMSRQLALAQRVFDSSSEGIIVTDAENIIVSANPAVEAITGYRSEELLGRSPRIFKSGRHDRTFYERLWNTLLTDGHWRGEIWDRSKTGRIYPKHVSINAVRDPDSQRIVNFVAVFSDISEQKATEARLNHEARHDPLTGLANRHFLRQHIEHAHKLARRQQTPLAVLFIDLDEFKTVNDNHGHAVGDRLLIAVAERLRQSTRESDVVARLGGDEFVIVVEGCGTTETLMRMANSLIDKISQPCTIDALTLSIGCSIGIARSNPGSMPDELLARADTAMYSAKAAGRGRMAFYRDKAG